MTAQTIDPVIGDTLDRLSNQLHEEIKERVSSLEFKSAYPQRLASCLGLLEILRRNLTGLSGVSVMQIELDGATQWIATTDLDYARQHLADMHATEIAVLDLRTTIDEQYSGVAALTFLS
ncbi:MAG: hypothetical protein Q7J42_06460 [Sulfuritalea sp.]|nr:hypothetical protein [Sulfuritalea sp.]